MIDCGTVSTVLWGESLGWLLDWMVVWKVDEGRLVWEGGRVLRMSAAKRLDMVMSRCRNNVCYLGNSFESALKFGLILTSVPPP